MPETVSIQDLHILAHFLIEYFFPFLPRRTSELFNHQVLRKREGYKPKTIDDELNYANTMIIKAFDNDLVGGDALKAFRKVERLLPGNKKGTNARTRLLTRKDLRKIKKYVKSRHTKDLLNFGDWTGMRAGKIMKLRWSMVDLAGNIITLPESVTKEARE